ncbi:MAG: hypothetical protein JNM79_03200 [Burkholderiales bacterium]|nr:hypothetical protein [Burkholderiales bacterium]
MALVLAAALGAASTASQATPAAAAVANAPPPVAMALVIRDQAVLRAAPRDSSPTHATLIAGEIVEVRGERLDHFQVWDHHRERGGYVRVEQLKVTRFAADEAADLLGLVRFVRESRGAEALGIGLAAAYVKSAAPADLRGETGAEAFEAVGRFAERLAQRAALSGSGAGVAAQMDVAARYGVRFVTFESDGQLRHCYDGQAYAQALVLSRDAARRARSVLALTRPDCVDSALSPSAAAALAARQADLLDALETQALPATLKNRVYMRRAAVHAMLAFLEARRGASPTEAAQRSLSAFALVNRAELTDDDQAAYNDAAMRANASRWAAVPAAARQLPRGLTLTAQAGQPGETCVRLAAGASSTQSVSRCTYGQVWVASATANREGTAVALAVQVLPAWRELWLFRHDGQEWAVTVLPPAAVSPGLGYAEFAGWVPGGNQVLVAREARGENRYRRSYEVLNLQSLIADRQSGEPATMGAFQRWADPQWRTLSLAATAR